MDLSLDTWIGLLQFLAGGALASLVWLFRLEGNTKVLKTRVDGLEKRQESSEAQIIAHLERIESQLYSLLQARGVR